MIYTRKKDINAVVVGTVGGEVGYRYFQLILVLLLLVFTLFIQNIDFYNTLVWGIVTKEWP
jgi:hypothetical protein